MSFEGADFRKFLPLESLHPLQGGAGVFHAAGRVMVFCALLICLGTHAASASDAAAFNFETGFPESCILESGRTARPKNDMARVGADEKGRSSNVCLSENPNRGGVFIRPVEPADTDALGKSFPALTVCMAFRASPASSSPTFLERLVGGTSDHVGFFRFRSQMSSGDDHERRGTLRFSTKTPGGESEGAASTESWILQENVWNWVGVVFDRGRVAFYVNGERLGNVVDLPLEEIPGAEGSPYFVRAGYGFSGAFDDLFVLPGKALTEQQMRDLYQKGIQDGEIKKFIQQK